MRKIALIPAYCPPDSLVQTAGRMKEYGFEVVVVNDGSPKEYDPLFQKVSQKAEVLSYHPNQGKGHALKHGLSWILERELPSSIVVTLDADGQHSPADALACACAASCHPDSLVLGVRDFDGKDVPWKSRLGNRITSLVFRFATHRKLSDTQTGLRAFSAQMIPLLLQSEGERYDYEMNALLDACARGTPFVQIPIETIYHDRKNSASHFHPVRDSFLIYRRLLKFALSSLAGFGIDYSLFALFSALFTGTNALVLSNVSARAVSAYCNYQINRHLVFQDKEKASVSAPRYILLAAGILAVNTLLLKGMVDVLGVNRYLAKILVEVTLFFFSYFIQKNFVFSKKEGIAL